MALDRARLKAKIETELKAQDIVIDGEHAQASKFATAIANAIVDEITQNALVAVTAGSSQGNYKMQ